MSSDGVDSPTDLLFGLQKKYVDLRRQSTTVAAKCYPSTGVVDSYNYLGCKLLTFRFLAIVKPNKTTYIRIAAIVLIVTLRQSIFDLNEY